MRVVAHAGIRTPLPVLFLWTPDAKHGFLGTRQLTLCGSAHFSENEANPAEN